MPLGSDAYFPLATHGIGSASAAAAQAEEQSACGDMAVEAETRVQAATVQAMFWRIFQIDELSA